MYIIVFDKEVIDKEEPKEKKKKSADFLTCKTLASAHKGHQLRPDRTLLPSTRSSQRWSGAGYQSHSGCRETSCSSAGRLSLATACTKQWRISARDVSYRYSHSSDPDIV
jgi:hypothetical protein